MIQELFGGSNNNNPGFISGTGDRKMLSVNGSTGPILQPHPSTILSSPSPSLPPPSLTASNSANSKNPASTANNNQMQCPRCDSANTKFCYYNNYNLTQPRYFCKTCRRYWTKGGALRNVPIGGGCRRNKPTLISSTKPKPTAGDIMISSTPTPPTPILWGSPHTSHLLPLLRSSSSPANNIPLYYYQNPSPNPSPALESLGRSVGLDSVPSLGMGSSLWRSSSSSAAASSNYAPQNGFTLSDHQQQSNGGVKELYQRLGFFPGNNYDNHSQSASTTAVVSSSTSSPSVLELAPVNNGGAELGFWNNSSTFSWSDLQPSTTTNGTYP